MPPNDYKFDELSLAYFHAIISLIANIQNQISVLSTDLFACVVNQYKPSATGQIKAEIYHHCR